LLHTNELFAYFLNEYPNDYANLQKKNKHVESEGKLSKAFYEIVKGLQDNNNYRGNSFNYPTTNFKHKKGKKDFYNYGNSFSPDNFKRVLGFYNSQFRKFEANDSKDLILYLLQTMHEELNYFGDNNSPSNGSPNQYNELNTFTFFMHSYHSRNFSIISNIFYGTYENITQCLECNKIIYNFQKFEFISFGMYDYQNKPFNIYDGFEDNQKIQLLKGDNKFLCNNCKKLCEAKICCKIIQPPNKLLINIDYGKNKKYEPSKIIFDETIDITKYINFNFGTNIRYRIICVCTHYGFSGSYGHYIAFCRHRLTGQWYKFNFSTFFLVATISTFTKLVLFF
jgi:ubiquitin C-terminal hydrolase